MAVNWNLAGRPPSFAEMLQAGDAGRKDRNELDRQAARVAAGQAYVGGDKIGAARALAGAGEVSAAAGIVDDVDTRGRADAEASRAREAQVWAKAVPLVQAALRKPDGGSTAREQFRVAARQAGATPEEEEEVLRAFDTDPRGYLEALAAQAERELKVVGRSVVDMTDPANVREVYTAPGSDPRAPAGYEFGADGELRYIPGGPADPAVIGRTSGARRDAVVSRPMPSRARSGGGGGGGRASDEPPPGFTQRVR